MKRALAAVLAASCAACAPPTLKLPSGTGTPLDTAEAATTLADANGACAALKTWTAEINVSGSAAGQRVRGKLVAGVAFPASVRLEAAAPFGSPLFIFVAERDDATLLLPRDGRVLEHGRPAEVLDALTGVPLGAADLDRALTGCVADGRAIREARRFGDSWIQVSSAAGDAYLRRDRPDAPWRVVAAVQGDWRIDYRDFQTVAAIGRALPATSVLSSAGQSAHRFNLQLAATQIEVNVALDQSAFSVRVPPSATPISIAELKAGGPLGTGKSSER